ncbi:hypothetical protein [Tsukamurella sp. USMM236]|uniref:hypothetical protein n=1 Tax=Tsukamurella sp. USMM236 TaxID=3081301 RepID=UPI00301A15DC
MTNLRRIATPHVLNANDDGQITVSIELSEAIPTKWGSHLKRAATTFDLRADVNDDATHPQITFGCSADHLASAVADMDTAITAANLAHTDGYTAASEALADAAKANATAARTQALHDARAVAATIAPPA